MHWTFRLSRLGRTFARAKCTEHTLARTFRALRAGGRRQLLWLASKGAIGTGKRSTPNDSWRLSFVLRTTRHPALASAGALLIAAKRAVL